MSDQKYVVKAVRSQRDWPSKYGPMRSYQIDLEDSQGQLMGDIELAQKESSPAPTVGLGLEGTIDRTGSHGPKFKKAQRQQQSGGGGRSGGGGARQRDPNERRSIERQVAFKGAIEIVSSMDLSNLDSDSTKSLLTGFFNHGLSLIQADEAELIEDVFPGAQEEPAAEPAPRPHQATGGGPARPMDHALAEVKELLAQWTAPNAADVWENKLTSLGLGSPAEADALQIDEIIEFLREQVATQ